MSIIHRSRPAVAISATAATVLSAALVLSACSADAPDANSTNTSSTSNSAVASGAASDAASSSASKAANANASNAAASELIPAAEGKTQYPLTLDSPYGTTVLEKRPERIAAIVPNGIDAELLLSLGVTPVLSSSMIREGGYLEDHGAADLETYEFVRGADVPFEAIAASKPDLIVTVGWVPGFGEVKDIYDRLATIAPVVTSPPSTQRITSWKDSLRILGKTLDLENAAEAVISEHDQLFAQIRKEHPEFGGKTATWAIYYGPASGLQYFSQNGSAPEQFLTDMGFAPNPNAAEFAKDTNVSDELLSKIDADVLLLGQSQRASNEELEEHVTGTDLFKNLNAVKSGKFVLLPPKTADGGDLLWAITSGGPIGNAWAAQQVVPMIAEKF
ncbi:ABC transporter substrate-binding protein [Corynebacterium lizhenjunii]|uniref:ABC transporter substrate-binding protein n=1 Tax=Corynebacterium lizhenjunii TaxID=2709394 RepID=A0A7T0KFU9_9CORY|nr:ABC transporter substrate-binding protein [Corynebacterium lizhenjunii]QPK79219.1 ABC transporter substrate-binding protein [Corynebacterium lizhenjunii]